MHITLHNLGLYKSDTAKFREGAPRDAKKELMNIEEIANSVIGCAIEVHHKLGPGLLESAYQTCLMHELKSKGLNVRQEVPMPIIYKEIKLDHGYRMDILVEEQLVIEIKTVEAFSDIHHAQMITYLKLGNYRLGLLLNFHVTMLEQGIKRVINSK